MYEQINYDNLNDLKITYLSNIYYR